MKAALTNLGMYNEGTLNFVWIDLPIDKDDFNEALASIKVCNDEEDFYDEAGNPYEEYFVSDYDELPKGIKASDLGEYPDMDKLNEIAETIEDDEELFSAVCGVYGVDKALNADLRNDYILLSSITDDYDLGWYYAEECQCVNIPDNLKNYFDYEAFGRDIRFETDGGLSDYGWIERA